MAVTPPSREVPLPQLVDRETLATQSDDDIRRYANVLHISLDLPREEMLDALFEYHLEIPVLNDGDVPYANEDRDVEEESWENEVEEELVTAKEGFKNPPYLDFPPSNSFPLERFPSPPRYTSSEDEGTSEPKDEDAAHNGSLEPRVEFVYPPSHPLSPEDPQWLDKMFDALREQRRKLLAQKEAVQELLFRVHGTVFLAEREVDKEADKMQHFLEKLHKISGSEIIERIIKDADYFGSLGTGPPGHEDPEDGDGKNFQDDGDSEDAQDLDGDDDAGDVTGGDQVDGEDAPCQADTDVEQGADSPAGNIGPCDEITENPDEISRECPKSGANEETVEEGNLMEDLRYPESDPGSSDKSRTHSPEPGQGRKRRRELQDDGHDGDTDDGDYVDNILRAGTSELIVEVDGNAVTRVVRTDSTSHHRAAKHHRSQSPEDNYQENHLQLALVPTTTSNAEPIDALPSSSVHPASGPTPSYPDVRSLFGPDAPNWRPPNPRRNRKAKPLQRATDLVHIHRDGKMSLEHLPPRTVPTPPPAEAIYNPKTRKYEIYRPEGTQS